MWIKTFAYWCLNLIIINRKVFSVSFSKTVDIVFQCIAFFFENLGQQFKIFVPFSFSLAFNLITHLWNPKPPYLPPLRGKPWEAALGDCEAGRVCGEHPWPVTRDPVWLHLPACIQGVHVTGQCFHWVSAPAGGDPGGMSPHLHRLLPRLLPHGEPQVDLLVWSAQPHGTGKLVTLAAVWALRVYVISRVMSYFNKTMKIQFKHSCNLRKSILF